MSKVKTFRRKSILVAASAVSAGLFYAGTSRAATETWNGGGGNNLNWSNGFNWSPVAAPVAGDAVVFDGFGGLTNTNDLAAALTLSGITFAPTAGAFTIGGASITLGGDITDNTTILTQNLNLPLILNATRNVNVTSNGVLRLGGVISGTGFGLNKTGLGVLTLAGTNTFTGPVTISQGVVSISNDLNLGAVPNPVSSGALVVNGGTLRTTANMTISANRGMLVGPAGGAGNSIFDVASGTTTTYGGIIANNTGATGGLSKISFGQLFLSGANTYTGTTAIKNGTIQLNMGATASATQNNVINSVSQLRLGGETAGLGNTSYARLIMNGATSATNTQSFSSTHLEVGPAVIQGISATGGSVTLNLGNITRDPGSLVNFILPTAGNIKTTSSNTNGILGGWATIGNATNNQGLRNALYQGSDLATVDGSGNIVAYTAYTNAVVYDTTPASLLASYGTAANNVRLASTNTAASEVRVAENNANVTVDINTFSFQNDVGGNAGTTPVHTLTIGKGNTLRLGQYGTIMRQSNSTSNNLIVGGGGGVMTSDTKQYDPDPNDPNNPLETVQDVGTLTAGGAPNTPGEIHFNMTSSSQTSGTTRIWAKIMDNGTGAVTVIKDGAASMKFDGHNTFSGGLYINQGRLQFTGSELTPTNADPTPYINPGAGGTGPIYIAPGAQLFPSGAGSHLVPGDVTNPIFLAGFGINADNTGAIRMGSGTILSGTITLTGDGRIGGGGGAVNIGNQGIGGLADLNRGYFFKLPSMNPPTSTALEISLTNNITGRITGPYLMSFGASGNAGGSGSNVIISNTANDWTGDTQITGREGSAGPGTLHLGASNVIPNGVGKGNLTFGTSALNSGSPTVLNLNGFDETINGLTTASSAFPGIAAIQNEKFTATVIDDPNNVGKKTYSYSGATTSTLTMGDWDQSASFGGVIRDTNPLNVSLPNPNWDGSTDPVNLPNGADADGDPSSLSIPSSAISAAGAKVAITKIGTGVQQLWGANTYTGATTINGGVLAINGSNSASSNVTVNSGGAVAGIGSLGPVTVNASGAIRPGSVGTGSFGTLTSSGAVNMTSGTLGIDFGPSLNDMVSASAVTFAGSNTITPSGTPTAGTYTVVNSASAISGAGTLSLTPFPNLPDQRPASGSLDLSNVNQVKVIVTGGAKTLDWAGSPSNDWKVPSAGGTFAWSDAVTLAPERFFNADIIRFTDSATNRNVNVVGAVQPGSMLINNAIGNDYTFGGTGSITGLTSVTKTGTGTASLNTNNTFSGGINVVAGTLQIGGTNSSAASVTGGATMSLGSGGTAGSVSGTITNDGILRFNRSDDFIVSNVIAGNGDLEKVGANTVTLTGNNTFVGGMNVLAGTVKVGGANFTPFGTGTGNFNVSAGGAIDVGGITAANVAGGFGAKNFNIAGTGVGGTGALTNSGTNAQQNAFQHISLNANASIGGTGRFDIRGGAAQLDLNNNTLTKDGTNQFSVVAGVIGPGNIIVNAGTFSIETTTSADANGLITYNTGSTGQFFQLNPGTPFVRPLQFNGGSFSNGNQANPSNIASNIQFNADTPMTVGGTGTGAQVVLSGTLTGTGGFSKTGVGRLQITGDPQYSGNTSFTGGTVEYILANPATLAGNMTGSTGTTLVKDGAGKLTIGGASLSVGHLDIKPNSQLALTPRSGTPNMASSRKTLYIRGQLSLDSTATLDLADNDLVVDNGVYTTVRAQVLAGIAGTTGIDSSTSTGGTRLALFDNALVTPAFTSWNGQTIAANAIVGKYTYFGDVNIDGQVTGDDYTVVDSNLGSTPPVGLEWIRGDANADGNVTGDDYTVIDANLGQGVGNPLSASSLGGGLTPSSLSVVPEPASLGLLATGAGLLLGRRRRRAN